MNQVQNNETWQRRPSPSLTSCLAWTGAWTCSWTGPRGSWSGAGTGRSVKQSLGWRKANRQNKRHEKVGFKVMLIRAEVLTLCVNRYIALARGGHFVWERKCVCCIMSVWERSGIARKHGKQMVCTYRCLTIFLTIVSFASLGPWMANTRLLWVALYSLLQYGSICVSWLQVYSLLYKMPSNKCNLDPLKNVQFQGGRKIDPTMLAIAKCK